MKDEKKLTEEIKSEELTDEQVNEVGGGVREAPSFPQIVKCEQCGKVKHENQMLCSYINGEMKYICFECAGVR